MKTSNLQPPISKAELTRDEAKELARHEKVIRGGLSKSVAVWRGLLAIRDGRLYRARYGSFEAYCAKRWKIGRSHAYRLVAGAELSDALPEGQQFANERQARAYREQLSPMGDTRRGLDPKRSAPAITYDDIARQQHNEALAAEVELIAFEDTILNEEMGQLQKLLVSVAERSRRMGTQLQAACNHQRMTAEFFQKHFQGKVRGLDFDGVCRLVGIAKKRDGSEVSNLDDAASLLPAVLGAKGLIEERERAGAQNPAGEDLWQQFLVGLGKLRMSLAKARRQREIADLDAAVKRSVVSDTEWIVGLREAML